jgi:hypothetical protein
MLSAPHSSTQHSSFVDVGASYIMHSISFTMRFILIATLLVTCCVDRTCSSIDDANIKNITNFNDTLLENNSTKSSLRTKTTIPAANNSLNHVVQSQLHESPITTVKKSLGKEIFQNAFKKAIGGGIPGAVAGVVQVLSLMWLRTVINYQYRYGSNFIEALSYLYNHGGVPRLYSGLGFALVQAPLARFVSTAANDGVHNLIQNLEWTKHWGPGKEVVVAACVVGFFRMILMPIDTSKTVLQIEGEKGFAKLMSQVKEGRIHLLYAGSFANAASSFISHYPWFYTYNKLSRNEVIKALLPWNTGRNAMIGFLSSIVSDTVANFMRVIKTTKQALSSRRVVTYAETISIILAADGLKGLFGRGLRTRIMANALQSVLFTVIWRSLAQRWQQQTHVEKDSVKLSSSAAVGQHGNMTTLETVPS